MTRKIFSWNALNRGDEIELLDRNMVIARGIVDAFTDDRAIIWLTPSYDQTKPSFHTSYAGSRRMFHRGTGGRSELRVPTLDRPTAA